MIENIPDNTRQVKIVTTKAVITDHNFLNLW